MSELASLAVVPVAAFSVAGAAALAAINLRPLIVFICVGVGVHTTCCSAAMLLAFRLSDAK